MRMCEVLVNVSELCVLCVMCLILKLYLDLSSSIGRGPSLVFVPFRLHIAGILF